jgi:NAD(P)H-hydrate epimerase
MVKGDAAANLSRLMESGAPEIAADESAWQRIKPSLESTTLLIDAILGTGLSKPLEGFLLGVVRDLKSLPRARVVAVDLPTGLSADSGELIGECLRADASVTFTAPKRAHVLAPACEYVGTWVVKPIGTPPELLEDAELFLNLSSAEEMEWLTRPRPSGSHKGNFGHVVVVAGSLGKTGAAAMAAKAAQRAGAGLVTVATAKSALPIVAGLGMEFMTEPLPETEAGTISLAAMDYARMDKLVAEKSVLAVGPGLGAVPETFELVRTIINKYDTPMVIDADALNAFAGCMKFFRSQGRVRVLTPHPGEMARLTGQTTSQIQAHRIEVAREFARTYNLTVVLKGFQTLSAAPDGQVWVNSTGNPGMATGGTGDILTGITAGLLAQYPKRPVIEVVRAAVYLHGLAGDLAAGKIGQTSMIAGDLLDALPQAFRALSHGEVRTLAR